jgi:hypothetical protein
MAESHEVGSLVHPAVTDAGEVWTRYALLHFRVP